MVNSYMSKAPGAAADYDGSGGWFKIKDWGTPSNFKLPPPPRCMLTTENFRPGVQRRHRDLDHGR